MSAPLTSPGGVVRPFGWSHFRSFGASSWIFACLLLCTLFLGIFALGLRPKSSFWPLRGHIFPLVFSSGLARSCCSLRLSSGSSFGLRPRAAAFRSVSVVFRSAGGVRLPSRLPGFWSFFRFFFGSFVVAAPVSLFLLFSLWASFLLFLWFLSRFCSLLYFICFFGYFRFVVISLYIFILFLYFFICPPIDKRKGRVDVGTIYPLE